MQKKVWIGFIVLLMLISTAHAQSKKSQWVDSVFSTLDLSGKIGQLLMVSVNSYSDLQSREKTVLQLKKYEVGGIVFTNGGPVSLVNTTNYFQQQIPVPLLIGMNAEEGLRATLDSVLNFPAPIMLGSIRDDSLLFFLGSEIGRQLNALGVNFNLTHSTDLNSSFKESHSLYSAYGENQNRATSKIEAYQNGMQGKNILSFIRHSPEAEIQIDSNKLLLLHPILKNSSGIVTAYGDDFLIKGKINSGSLTNSIDFIKQKFDFHGLSIIHTPDIQILNKKFKPGEAELFSFKAGYDILLFPLNLPSAVRKIRKSVRKNKSLQKQLDESVKKILETKYDAGLNQKKLIHTNNLVSRINTPASRVLQSLLFERSVTVVKDEEHVLPIKQLDNISFASISIGREKNNTFTSYLSKYAPFTHYQFQFTEDSTGLIKKLKGHNIVIAAIYSSINGNIDEYILEKVSEQSELILINFGPPARLNNNLATIIQAYSSDTLIQQFIPQLIFGAKNADGILPVSVHENLRFGQGIQTSVIGRMGYSIPEAEGLDSKTLKTISTIAQEAIAQRAAPGCQVLVARHGKIIYEKSFGSQTYENKIPVNDQTIYDLASLTKVAGTLQAVMFLYEKGLIDIYKKASVYLPELSNTNKKDIILKDILTHQSGLFPFLLMWPQTVKGDTLLAHYYSPMKTENYPLQVAPDLYASKSIQDSIWQWVLKSEMLVKPPRTPYSPRYSDLGFMILHRIAERLVNQPIEDFLSQNLYEPLGAGTVGYLPLTKFPSSQIAPTERDTVFRKSIVLGTVHDERAAMLGGVAGHAGLFGSATDLIKIGQMLLQKGSYGSQSFYKPETIDLFAQKQFENSSRGLGWAKSADPNSPSSRFNSPKAFGHTGFTGTCLWIDPEFDLVFVFLSNSRFPDRSGKLNSTNIRSRIQDVVYQSIFNYCQYGDTLPDEKLMRYLRKSNN